MNVAPATYVQATGVTIALPSGVISPTIVVFARNANGFRGFPSTPIIFTLTAPPAPTIGTITNPNNTTIRVPWTLVDKTDTYSFTINNGGTVPASVAYTINTIDFTIPNGRVTYTGTIIANNQAGTGIRNWTFTPEYIYTLTTVAGNVITSGNSNGTGSDALTARFSFNGSGVACDKNGYFYVADTANNVIRKINLTTGAVTTHAGGGSTVLTNTTPITATSAKLTQPMSICINSTGTMLYFTDSTKVYELGTSAGATITLIAGGGATAFTAGATITTPTTASLTGPRGIACAPSGTNVYFVDWLASKGNIRKLSYITSWTLANIAGGATSSSTTLVNGLATTRYISPTSLAIYSPPSETESVYFTDNYSNRIGKIIQRSTISLNDYVTVAGDASSAGASGSTNGTTWLTSSFNSPNSLVIDSAGNIFVRDGMSIRRVIKLKYDGTTVSTIAGDPGSITGDGTPATDYYLSNTYGNMYITSDGIIYFTDGNAVRRLE
jgi:sugar lactone lactonase YvrE